MSYPHASANFEPHPYALMLPALTDDEYAALKADIAKHGILYPVILDEDGRVLDGVHRCRIAAELGITPPVSQMGHLDEDRKLHLAVGLNMRRRHLDSDRRRELVRRLHRDEGLSVRRIAAVTGWSKSTVDRDLKPSPFEEILAGSTRMHESLLSIGDDLDNPKAVELFASLSDGTGGIVSILSELDGQWKRGQWPPPIEEHVAVSIGLRSLMHTLQCVTAGLQAAVNRDRAEVHRNRERLSESRASFDRLRREWDAASPERRREIAEEMRADGALIGVPSGTKQ